MARGLRSTLLNWYDRNRRDLPWRRTRDPYAIWVSEVMLQQTRVDTVIRYYDRFLDRFPTAAALANADEDDVMAMWSGLGYYRRARMLHAGAREVTARYGGVVPEAAVQRRALPGVGRYTAGAIGSIAFDLPEPIVDGNVARVFARVLEIDAPISKPDAQRRFWSEAERLVRGPRPGSLNQALMELGATVCTPRQPTCAECPIRSFCGAFRSGRTDALPVMPPRRDPARQELSAVVAKRGEHIWLAKSTGGLFGGLWGVPMVTRDSGVRDSAKHALREVGLQGRVSMEPAGHVEHRLTHRLMVVAVFRATAVRVRARSRKPATAVLHAANSLHELGVSRLTRKIIDAANGS